jgi:uncharacterized delta-60 repeat protein
LLIAGNTLVNISGVEIGAMTMLMLNTDGSDAIEFGNGGKVISTPSEFNNGFIRLNVQSDGKIVAVGFAVSTPPNYDLGILRYNSDGRIDSSFGYNGIVITDFSQFDFPHSIAIDSLNRIIVAGQCNNVACLARYLPNGEPDPEFAGGGKTTLSPVGSNDIYRSMVLVKDGRMIIAGIDTDPPKSAFLICLDKDGELDPTFGDEGILTTRFGLSTATFDAMVAQPDGRVVTVGLGEDESGTVPEGILAARFFTSAYTHISSMKNPGRLTIVPNPAKTEFLLHTTILEPGIYDVILCDVAGKYISTILKNQNLNKGSQSFRIPLDEINGGIYQVQVHSEEGMVGFGRIIVGN